MKVSELKDEQLDFWVGKAEEKPTWIRDGVCMWHDKYGVDYPYSPSSDWSQGGPIIERERICVRGPGPMGGPDPEYYWTAYIDTGSYAGGGHNGHGRTPLEAAMRCFVASKFGDEIEES